MAGSGAGTRKGIRTGTYTVADLSSHHEGQNEPNLAHMFALICATRMPTIMANAWRAGPKLATYVSRIGFRRLWPNLTPPSTPRRDRQNAPNLAGTCAQICLSCAHDCKANTWQNEAWQAAELARLKGSVLARTQWQPQVLTMSAKIHETWRTC